MILGYHDPPTYPVFSQCNSGFKTQEWGYPEFIQASQFMSLAQITCSHSESADRLSLDGIGAAASAMNAATGSSVMMKTSS